MFVTIHVVRNHEAFYLSGLSSFYGPQKIHGLQKAYALNYKSQT